MKAKKVFGGIVKAGLFFGGLAGIGYWGSKSIGMEREFKDRYQSYYQLTNQWLRNKNDKKEIASYLLDRGIKKIAIFGMGTMGEQLYSDIKSTGIEVKYFIDKNADELVVGLDKIPLKVPEDVRGQEDAVDAIIVTPFFAYDEIETKLRFQGCDMDIISLEDIIFGMQENMD